MAMRDCADSLCRFFAALTLRVATRLGDRPARSPFSVSRPCETINIRFMRMYLAVAIGVHATGVRECLVSLSGAASPPAVPGLRATLLDLGTLHGYQVV